MASTNWQAIEAADIWHDQIRPFVEELRTDALEDMSHAENADKFRYWQGYVTALKAVLDTPQDMIEAEKLAQKQEKEEDGRRNDDRRNHFARIRAAIGIGGTGRRGDAEPDR